MDDDHNGRLDECVCDWQALPDGRPANPDPTCPQHGERPWAVCDRCNYDLHTCPGCGVPLPHGTEVCVGCDTSDLPPPGVIVYEAEEDPRPMRGWISGGMW